MTLTHEQIRAVPKVLLHDHLDGGLRPSTVIELARENGYDGLPTADADELTNVLTAGAHRGHLNLYLDAFRHTVGVMQTRESLERVAAECAADLAADGIVYAEVRFAPELHTGRGLTLDEVVEAVLAGFRAGSAHQPIRVYALLTAMRTAARSLEIAELAVRFRDEGVVGFDIAGAEAGWPPSRHLDAFGYIHRENFHATVHAGEGFGLPSIWEAVQYCGAERLGHGVRIVDDISVGSSGEVRLGPLASYVRDRRIPLELCPTSNVQTGAAASIAEHPIRLLRQLQFRVTVNTDNRLMSQVTLSSEFSRLIAEFGYGWSDVEWLTINAMKSAFAGFDERLRLINTVIKPGFAMARAMSDAHVAADMLTSRANGQGMLLSADRRGQHLANRLDEQGHLIGHQVGVAFRRGEHRQTGPVTDRHDQQQALLHLDQRLGGPPGFEDPRRAQHQARQPGSDGRELLSEIARDVIRERERHTVR